MAQDYWCGYWRHSPYGRAVHGAIYELENGIAFLEADPETPGARTDIRRLNAMLDSARGMADAVLLWPQAHQTADGAPNCPGSRRPNLRCRIRSDQPLSRSR